MENFLELLKSILFGILQGITEWLPISSTGHLILLEEFLSFENKEFFDMFKVVIQLGSILAVIVVYFGTLFPIAREGGKLKWKKSTLSLWGKVIIGCIPAGIIGILIDDFVDRVLSVWYVIAAALILYGIAFIVLERVNRGRTFRIRSVEDIDYKTAFEIGCFQVLALVPGTSRSGSTILGASLIGVDRKPAAEFSFFLAVPVMFGASALKLFKFGFAYTGTEILVLLCGSLTAFLVSLAAIRFLISFVRRHSFEGFGWYRIVLGILVILRFVLA